MVTYVAVGGRGGYLFEKNLLSGSLLVLSQFCITVLDLFIYLSFSLHSQDKRCSGFKRVASLGNVWYMVVCYWNTALG